MRNMDRNLTKVTKIKSWGDLTDEEDAQNYLLPHDTVRDMIQAEPIIIGLEPDCHALDRTPLYSGLKVRAAMKKAIAEMDRFNETCAAEEFVTGVEVN